MVHSTSTIRLEWQHDKTVRMSSVTFLIKYWWSESHIGKCNLAQPVSYTPREMSFMWPWEFSCETLGISLTANHARRYTSLYEWVVKQLLVIADQGYNGPMPHFMFSAVIGTKSVSYMLSGYHLQNEKKSLQCRSQVVLPSWTQHMQDDTHDPSDKG